MAKNRIRLTESQLNRIIKESVKRVLKEAGDWSDYDKAAKIKADADKAALDNETFELAASKIVTDYASRVALKGVIIQAHLLDKVFDLMDNTKVDQIDADTFLLIDKAFNYQDKLFSILDRYKKPGVEESLRHLAKVSSQKPEEAPKLSTSEMQMIIDQINKAKSKELEGGDNDSSKWR